MNQHPRRPATAPSRGSGILLAVVLALVAADGRLDAISTCQNGSCAACAPSIPGAVSTYIADTAFPPEADVPIAFVDPADGLHHRFVATQEGAILVWNTQTQTFNATPFLDLRNDGGGPGLDKVNYDFGERGLLSMAFDPDYATTGRFWVYYTSRPQPTPTIANGDIVVEGYLRSGGNPEIASTDAHAALPHHARGDQSQRWAPRLRSRRLPLHLHRRRRRRLRQRPGYRTAMASSRRRSSARSCASTCAASRLRRRHRNAVSTVPTTRFPTTIRTSDRRTPATRSSSSACATRSVSVSTASQATSTSATSARTTTRSSTCVPRPRRSRRR